MNIYGHQQNKVFLHKLLEHKENPPALLFHGMEGIGKRALAIEFAKEYLCQNNGREVASCSSCHYMESGTHPDFILVEREQRANGSYRDILIEQIQKLNAQAAYAPAISDYKVCIIDGADAMNQEAANALLKLLEEPPDYWLFILVATDINKLLPTILSRVQQVRFAPLPREELQQALELRGYTQDLEVITTLAEGSLKRALELIDKGLLEQRKIVLEYFHNFPSNNLVGLLQTPWGEKLEAGRALDVLETMVVVLRDGLLYKEGARMLSEDLQGTTAGVFGRWSARQIKSAIYIVRKHYLSLGQSISPKNILEGITLELNALWKEK